MQQLNLSDEWYANALEAEGDFDVSIGPTCFSFVDREIDTKADQI